MQDDDDEVEPAMVMTPFGMITQADFESRVKSYKNAQEVSIDSFQNELHSFLAGLTKEQLIFFETILRTFVAGDMNLLWLYVGLTDAYLRTQHDYCAATQAPAGEKIAMHMGLDDPDRFLDNTGDTPPNMEQ